MKVSTDLFVSPPSDASKPIQKYNANGPNKDNVNRPTPKMKEKSDFD